MPSLAIARDALGWACACLSFAGCGFLLAAIMVVRWRSIEEAPQSSDAPDVSVLKPLCGDERGLERRLASFENQRYRGAIQLVLGLHDRQDAAAPVAQRIVGDQPSRTAAMVIDGHCHGSNRKISNLLHCYAHADHDVIVMSDSDIEVGDDYVRRVVDALAPPGIGAVTCLYEGQGDTLGGHFSAQAINAHFLPNVLVGLAFGAAKPCFGSTIALRRDTLERIGGLEAVANKLADDYAIGEAVRGLGLKVAVPPFAVRHACTESTLAAFAVHQLRVHRTIRRIDPLGYLGTVATNPFPLALFGCVAASQVCGWLALAALACRFVLLRSVARRFAMAPQRFWLIPFCDTALFLIFLTSFCGSKVRWRGHHFGTRPDGTLVLRKEVELA